MYLEVLNKGRRELFPLLAEFSEFYLVGGTALALQIGHRVSVDFDLFSHKKINPNLLGRVEDLFGGKKVEVSVNNKDELTVFVDGIKVTFFHYPFPVIEKLVSLRGLSVLGVREITISKAYTIGRRGSYRDYVDIYFSLLGGYIKLEEIITLAEKKYGDRFNGRLFLEQLVYLDDIEDTKILFIKKAVTKSEVQNFFEEEVRKIKL